MRDYALFSFTTDLATGYTTAHLGAEQWQALSQIAPDRHDRAALREFVTQHMIDPADRAAFLDYTDAARLMESARRGDVVQSMDFRRRAAATRLRCTYFLLADDAGGCLAHAYFQDMGETKEK